MKWLLFLLFSLSAALVIASVLALVYQDEAKPYVDHYANLAGVLGFFVSVFGFVLTVSAVFETLKVTKQAQWEIQRATDEARKQTNDLLAKIRVRIVEDTCEQAFLAASDARKAIRSGDWLRAADRCQDARQFASRLLAFRDLLDAERVAIRAVVEDVNATVAFIERNRLKEGAPSGMPDEKIQPLDLLLDELDKIRSRLQQQILEVSHVDFDRPTS